VFDSGAQSVSENPTYRDLGYTSPNMSVRSAWLVGLLAVPLILPLSGYVQAPGAGNPRPARSGASLVAGCFELSFNGRIDGRENYSRQLGDNLQVRFMSLKDDWGWVVSIAPEGTDDDYAWPVNPPFHFGNSQYLGTGYGETVEHELRDVPHRIFFVLDRSVYDRAVALTGKGAEQYLAALPTIPTGILDVKPTKFEVANGGQSVTWMEYSVTVIVPDSFRSAAGLNPRKIACPAMHWGAQPRPR
jgi:hypothetical protein